MAIPVQSMSPNNDASAALKCTESGLDGDASVIDCVSDSASRNPTSGFREAVFQRSTYDKVTMEMDAESGAQHGLHNDAANPLADNDDDRTVATLLQRLNNRPSTQWFWFSIFAGVIWTMCLLAVSAADVPVKRTLLSFLFQNNGISVGYLLLAVLPALVMPVVAQLLWRASEYRNISQYMSVIALRLIEPDKSSERAIASLGHSIRREVMGMTDGVERAIARAADLEDIVSREAATLERSFISSEANIRILLDDITKSISEKLDDIDRVIGARALKLGTHLDTRIQRFEASCEQIDVRSQAAADILSSCLERVFDTVKSASAEATKELSKIERSIAVTSNSVEKSIFNAGTEAERKLHAASSAAVSQIDGSCTQIQNAIQSLLVDISQNVSDVCERTESTMNGGVERLSHSVYAAADEVEKKIAKTAFGAEETLQIIASGLESAVSSALLAAEDRLSNCSTAMALNIKEHTDEFETVVSNMSGNVVRLITQISSDTESTVRRSVEEGTAAIVKAAKEGADALTECNEIITKSVLNNTKSCERDLLAIGSSIENTFINASASVSGSLSAAANSCRSELFVITSELERRLSDYSRDVSNALQESGNRFEMTIEQASENAEILINGVSSKADNALRNNISQFETSVTIAWNELETAISGSASSAVNKLIEQTDNVERVLLTTISDVEHRLTEASVTAVHDVTEKSSEIEKLLNSISQSISSTLMQSAKRMSDTIKTSASEITDVLDERSGGVIAALDNKGKQFADDIRRATSEAVVAIDSEGMRFGKTMLDNSSSIAAVISSATEVANLSLSKGIDELKSNSKITIEECHQAASTVICDIVETNSRLRSETTLLFDRLINANRLLQDVINGANENVESFEQTLVSRVNAFVVTANELADRTDGASNNVDRILSMFQETIAVSMQALTKKVEDLESCSTTITDAANIIDRNGIQTGEMIAQRQAAVDSMLSLLEIQTGDAERRFKELTAGVSTAIDTAISKAQTIESIIFDANANGSNAIDEQIVSFKNYADDHRQRTEEAIGRMTDEMKGELRALADSREKIVNATLERASTYFQTLANFTGERLDDHAQAMTATIKQMQDALARIPVERPPSRLRGEQRHAVPHSDDFGGIKGEPQQHNGRRIRENDEFDQFSKSHKRKGWLTDVLKRASDSDHAGAFDVAYRDAGYVDRALQSLENIAKQLSHVSDPALAADLIRRHKSGDRSVFSRYLYSTVKKMAYNKMQRGYRSNQELRMLVDRFIVEFEALRDVLERQALSDEVEHGALVSDMEKVYRIARSIADDASRGVGRA